MKGHAPEIGIGVGVVIAIGTFFGGWIMGVQQPLHYQALTLFLSFAFLNTWYFRALEIGALVYWLIWFAFFVGCVVGGISYFLQSGGNPPDISNFFDLFKVTPQ